MDRQSQEKDIKRLVVEVKELEDKLLTATAPGTFDLLESELYWLERRLAIETEFLETKEKKIEKLLSIAVALRERIASTLKLIKNQILYKFLEDEDKKLNKIINDLKLSPNDLEIEKLEQEIKMIESQISDKIQKN